MEFEKIKTSDNIEIKTADTLQDEVITAQPAMMSEDMQSIQSAQATQDEEQLTQSAPLIQQDLTENAALVTLSQMQHPAIPVTNTAPSSPQQKLSPVKKSWKQRKSDASHLKEVSKKTQSHEQSGDLTSYAIRQNLIQKQKNDSKKKLVPDYKKDHSTDAPEVKAAFLERFTKEMLGFHFSIDMFTNEYMEKHTADLKELYDRIAAFKLLKKDPANSDFFQNLPDADTQLLQTRMSQLTAFSELLETRFACKCVRLDGQYNTPEEQRAALAKINERETKFINASQQYELEKQARDKALEKLARDKALEQGLQYEKPEEIFTLENTVKLSKEEALSSHSDQLSREKRDQLSKILASCPEMVKQQPYIQAVITAVEDYQKGDRYTVGYTKETQLLQTALRALKDAILANPDEQSEMFLYNLSAYFDEMTNGTLKIPENAEVLDRSGQNPAETGTVSHGGARNALIRKFSYWSDQKDTPLFSHEPAVNDLKQRMVSNCYMLAGTAGLVNLSPEILKSCIKDNMDGTVTVRLYKKVYHPVENPAVPEAAAAPENIQAPLELTGDSEMDEFLEDMDVVGQQIQNARDEEATASYEPVYIKVSKEIPRVAGADALSAGALWMQMIEKACAFLGRGNATGYKSLWYGTGGEFLERLLGIPYTGISMGDPDTLFKEICSARKNQRVFNTGTGSDVGSDDGLNTGHAYTIMGGKEINGKRYVLLRNPYSTMSLEYQEDGKTSRTGHMLDTHSDETYGQFYMEFETFLQKFDSVTYTDLKQRAD